MLVKTLSTTYSKARLLNVSCFVVLLFYNSWHPWSECTPLYEASIAEYSCTFSVLVQVLCQSKVYLSYFFYVCRKRGVFLKTNCTPRYSHDFKGIDALGTLDTISSIQGGKFSNTNVFYKKKKTYIMWNKVRNTTL